MSYIIKWDSEVKHFLKKIDRLNAQRIIKKVNSIADEPGHYLETLIDIEGYKLRVGDYRAIVNLDEANKTIEVLLVGHRREIYQHIAREKFRKK